MLGGNDLNNYFNESYQTDNGRWLINIRKEERYITVCILNSSLHSNKYLGQYCININERGFDGHYQSLPNYLQQELKDIQKRYFKEV